MAYFDKKEAEKFKSISDFARGLSTSITDTPSELDRDNEFNISNTLDATTKGFSAYTALAATTGPYTAGIGAAAAVAMSYFGNKRRRKRRMEQIQQQRRKMWNNKVEQYKQQLKGTKRALEGKSREIKKAIGRGMLTNLMAEAQQEVQGAYKLLGMGKGATSRKAQKVIESQRASTEGVIEELELTLENRLEKLDLAAEFAQAEIETGRTEFGAIKKENYRNLQKTLRELENE